MMPPRARDMSARGSSRLQKKCRSRSVRVRPDFSKDFGVAHIWSGTPQQGERRQLQMKQCPGPRPVPVEAAFPSRRQLQRRRMRLPTRDASIRNYGSPHLLRRSQSDRSTAPSSLRLRSAMSTRTLESAASRLRQPGPPARSGVPVVRSNSRSRPLRWPRREQAS